MKIVTNKKARFNYEIIDTYTAGLVLTGSEIKSIRNKDVSIENGFVKITAKMEMLLFNSYIKPFEMATHINHESDRIRKLLLNKKEIIKWYNKMQGARLAIVPLEIFIDNNSRAKLVIGLAKGKNLVDKRNTIKERDLSRANKKQNNF